MAQGERRRVVYESPGGEPVWIEGEPAWHATAVIVWYCVILPLAGVAAAVWFIVLRR